MAKKINNKKKEDKEIIKKVESTVVESSEMPILEENKEEKVEDGPEVLDTPEMPENGLKIEEIIDKDVIDASEAVENMQEPLQKIEELFTKGESAEAEALINEQIDKLGEIEEMLEKKVEENEKQVKNMDKDFVNKVFSSYWNGQSDGWLS